MKIENLTRGGEYDRSGSYVPPATPTRPGCWLFLRICFVAIPRGGGDKNRVPEQEWKLNTQKARRERNVQHATPLSLVCSHHTVDNTYLTSPKLASTTAHCMYSVHTTTVVGPQNDQHNDATYQNDQHNDADVQGERDSTNRRFFSGRHLTRKYLRQI